MQDPQGSCPLHCAAMYGQEGVMHFLAGMGASLEARDRAGNTPLLVAAREGHTSSVQSLLNLGSKLDPINADRMSAASLAVAQGSEAMLQLLLAHGASVGHPSNLLEMAVRDASSHKGHVPADTRARSWPMRTYMFSPPPPIHTYT